MEFYGDPGFSARWVFGHGSLMFAPGFHHVARLPARVTGWERRYGQPSVRNWGVRSAPAPTASLVRGSSVAGVVFAVPPGSESETIEMLMAREAQTPIEVEVAVEDETMMALTWPMQSTWATLTIDELTDAAVRNIRSGGGPSGDALDYLEGVAGVLGEMGGMDPLTADYRTSLRRRLDDSV